MSNRDDMIRAAGKLLMVQGEADPNSIVEYKVDGETKTAWKCSNLQYEGQMMLKDFAWPVQVRAELVAVLTEQQKLKKAYDDSIGLIYQLANKIARGEIDS